MKSIKMSESLRDADWIKVVVGKDVGESLERQLKQIVRLLRKTKP